MIGPALDAILVLVVAEGLGLTMLHRRTGRGPHPALLWPNLAAGFLLMLGVRLALGSRPLPPARETAIAAVLAVALLAHVIDLAARWHAR